MNRARPPRLPLTLQRHLRIGDRVRLNKKGEAVHGKPAAGVVVGYGADGYDVLVTRDGCSPNTREKWPHEFWVKERG